MEITTDHKFRNLLYGYELTEKERKDFDYLNWDETPELQDTPIVDNEGYTGHSYGEGLNHAFFRYRGEIYDTGEFSADWGITKNSGLPDSLRDWDGYISDTYFSGIVIKFDKDGEAVKVGRFFTG